MLQPKLTKPKVAEAPSVRSEPTHTAVKRFTVPVPADQSVAEELPAIEELKHAVIGSEDSRGKQDEQGASSMQGTGNNNNSTGTGTDIADDEILKFADKSPEFPGGQQAFAKFIQKNLHYPLRASEAGISGKVIVNFVVEKDGSITEIKLVRGIGLGCDEEALRVLKKVPSWIPGEQNGRKVRVMFTIPLLFQLEN